MTEKKLPGRPIGRVARTITAVMMLKPIDPYQQSLSPVPNASLPPSLLPPRECRCGACHRRAEPCVAAALLSQSERERG